MRRIEYVVALLAQHQPPLRRGRLRPQAEKRERGGVKNGRCDAQRALYDERRKRIRENVIGQNLEGRGAHRAGRGDKIQFLRENDTVKITFYDNKALDMELPQNVILTVVETEPGIKGATAAAQTKPATLDTGLIIQVPSFITQGESIVVDTTDGKGKYLRRSKE